MCNIHWNLPKFQWTLRNYGKKRRCTIAGITVPVTRQVTSFLKTELNKGWYVNNTFFDNTHSPSIAWTSFHYEPISVKAQLTWSSLWFTVNWGNPQSWASLESWLEAMGSLECKQATRANRFFSGGHIPVSTLLNQWFGEPCLSLVSGCRDRWSSQKSKYQEQRSSSGRLATFLRDGIWI